MVDLPGQTLQLPAYTWARPWMLNEPRWRVRRTQESWGSSFALSIQHEALWQHARACIFRAGGFRQGESGTRTGSSKPNCAFRPYGQIGFFQPLRRRLGGLPAGQTQPHRPCALRFLRGHRPEGRASPRRWAIAEKSPRLIAVGRWT